jgi:hypothetical protein
VRDGAQSVPDAPGGDGGQQADHDHRDAPEHRVRGHVLWEFDIPKASYRGAERLVAALQA